MSITRLDFRPIAQGGDNPTAAFVKLDANDADLDSRLAAVKATADGAATKAYADSTFLAKGGGALTGLLSTNSGITMTGAAANLIVTYRGIFGLNGAPAGVLDVRTGVGGYVFRTNGPEPIIDGIANDNSGFGQLGTGGTLFSFLSRTGDNRQLMRTSGSAMSLDSVNGANNAFKTQIFTATGFTFNGGNVQVNGNITASGSITPSDERLKENIVPRVVNRGMALSLARAFSEWDLIASGLHQAGVVAQVAQGICPFWVSEIDYTPPPVFEEGSTDVTTFPSVKRLAVDMVGMAFESSMDNALSIEDLRAQLASALDRISALEAASAPEGS